MDWIVQAMGLMLVLVTLIDIFLTVLYARTGVGLLTPRLNRGVWRLFRHLDSALTSSDHRLLTYCGPTLLVLIAGLWVGLLIIGFALIAWPALGTGIQASQGRTPTDLATALYYSGYTLTTLGTGDIVPTTSLYRILMVIEAIIGFSVLTMTLTYFLSVYSALVRRNSFALSLHHQTSDMADAAELVARLGSNGDFSGARQSINSMASDLLNLLESHHSYPVLHYFRFREPYYALPRLALLAMDAATLIKSALDEEAYRSLTRSAAVTHLFNGGLHLLKELSQSFLPAGEPSDSPCLDHETTHAWRERYQRAVERLSAEGIATARDPVAGGDHYLALRQQWDGYVWAFADQLAFTRGTIAPDEHRP